MSRAEKRQWNSRKLKGDRLGSKSIEEARGLPYRPLCLATGGFWTDSQSWWQTEVALPVPKAKVRKWIEQGKAFVTPLGMSYSANLPIRVGVEREIPLPFELVSKSPKLHATLKQLHMKHRSRRAPDPGTRLGRYLHVGALHSRTNTALGLLTHAGTQEFFSPPIQRLPDWIHRPLVAAINRVQAMPATDPAKMHETVRVTRVFLKAAERYQRQNRGFRERQLGRLTRQTLGQLKSWLRRNQPRAGRR